MLALCPAAGGNGAVFAPGERLPDGTLRRDGDAGGAAVWTPAYFLPGDPLCPGDSGGGGSGDSGFERGRRPPLRADSLAARGWKDHVSSGFDPTAEHPGHSGGGGGSAQGAGSPKGGGKHPGFRPLYRCALRLPKGSGHGAAASGDESPGDGGGRAVGNGGAEHGAGDCGSGRPGAGNGACWESPAAAASTGLSGADPGRRIRLCH